MSLGQRVVVERGDGTLTVAPTTAVNQGATHRYEVDKIPAAPGVSLLAPIAAGAPLNNNGPFAVVRPARVARITLGVGGANPVVYTVTGFDVFGETITEQITATGPGTYEGLKAFDTVQNVSSDVNPGGTTTIATGIGFSFGPWTGLDSITDDVGVDGVLENLDSFDEATATVVPSTVPDGMHVYTIRFTCVTATVQNAHTHNLT
jgi:hypothetical protein